VTWTNLLANKEAQKHKTSKKELDNMRALIARDLADKGIAGLSADRRFATAYNAALQERRSSSKRNSFIARSRTGLPRTIPRSRSKIWLLFQDRAECHA